MNAKEFYDKLINLVTEANASGEVNNSEIVGVLEFTKMSIINSIISQNKEKP